ncbi:hypothetical protein HK102_003562, partial [Quaeritorhiza haematococci]
MEAIPAAPLVGSLERAGQWLRNMINPRTNRFFYEYEPARNLYKVQTNPIRELGTWAQVCVLCFQLVQRSSRNPPTSSQSQQPTGTGMSEVSTFAAAVSSFSSVSGASSLSSTSSASPKRPVRGYTLLASFDKFVHGTLDEYLSHLTRSKKFLKDQDTSLVFAELDSALGRGGIRRSCTSSFSTTGSPQMPGGEGEEDQQKGRDVSISYLDLSHLDGTGSTIAHSAMLILALHGTIKCWPETTDVDRYITTALELAEGVLNQQRSNGLFRVHIDPPKGSDDGWELYGGEAMLALARASELVLNKVDQKASSAPGGGFGGEGSKRGESDEILRGKLCAIYDAVRLIRANVGALQTYKDLWESRQVGDRHMVFFVNWQAQAARATYEGANRIETYLDALTSLSSWKSRTSTGPDSIASTSTANTLSSPLTFPFSPPPSPPSKPTDFEYLRSSLRNYANLARDYLYALYDFIVLRKHHNLIHQLQTTPHSVTTVEAACFLEGLADAYIVALQEHTSMFHPELEKQHRPDVSRRHDNRKRVENYRKGIDVAVNFLLQVQNAT